MLLSRQGLAAPGAEALCDELAATGVALTVTACDVTNRDALAAVLAAIPAEVPLTAVLHTAGATLGYLGVNDTTAADLASVAGGKVLGARHLDELTADLPLDAFVLFSSGAAVWGSAGSAAYGSANGYLDGLAAQRRARGLPATSIAWGAWRGSGMAGGDNAEVLGRIGFAMMDPDLAVTALSQAVAHADTGLVVADLDWERFAPSYAMSRRRPLIEGVPEAVHALRGSAGDGAEADASGLRSRLAGRSAAQRRETLTELVRAEAAAVLQLALSLIHRDSHGTAQPAADRHRPGAARHPALRPPDRPRAGGRAGRAPRRPGRGRAPPGRGGGADRRRPDRRRRHGLPLPRWRHRPGRALGAAGQRRGRHGRVPGGPRLADARPGRRTGPRPHLRRARRLPLRRGRLRRRVLRDLAARGRRDRSAAARAPGNRLGNPGTRRHRPEITAG